MCFISFPYFVEKRSETKKQKGGKVVLVLSLPVCVSSLFVPRRLGLLTHHLSRVLCVRKTCFTRHDRTLGTFTSQPTSIAFAIKR